LNEAGEFRYGSRLCENVPEPRTPGIVFSIAFFRQKLPVQLVFTSTKSRWKFYAQVRRESFHTAWVSGSYPPRNPRPLAPQKRTFQFQHCIDWRHLCEALAAGKGVYSELKNLVVWAKTNAGQGSFYRSQHELILVFKSGHGDRQAPRDEKGDRGLGAPAGRDHAPHLGRWHRIPVGAGSRRGMRAVQDQMR
jgi:hypothetical protein